MVTIGEEYILSVNWITYTTAIFEEVVVVEIYIIITGVKQKKLFFCRLWHTVSDVSLNLMKDIFPIIHS